MCFNNSIEFHSEKIKEIVLQKMSMFELDKLDLPKIENELFRFGHQDSDF